MCLQPLCARMRLGKKKKKGEVVYKGSIELEKENVNFYHATAQPFLH